MSFCQNMSFCQHYVNSYVPYHFVTISRFVSIMLMFILMSFFPGTLYPVESYILPFHFVQNCSISHHHHWADIVSRGWVNLKASASKLACLVVSSARSWCAQFIQVCCVLMLNTHLPTGSRQLAISPTAD